MFETIKSFWVAFWQSFRNAYNAVTKHPTKSRVQKWQEIIKINLLDIFVTKLNNLCNTEATFEINSDSSQTEPLKQLVKNLESKRYDIVANMLADGDYYIFPAHDVHGKIKHTFLSQEQVRIINTCGDDITQISGIIDWFVDDNNKVYYLLRHHELDINGTLKISYSTVNEQGNNTQLKQWEYINGKKYEFKNLLNFV